MVSVISVASTGDLQCPVLSSTGEYISECDLHIGTRVAEVPLFRLYRYYKRILGGRLALFFIVN